MPSIPSLDCHPRDIAPGIPGAFGVLSAGPSGMPVRLPPHEPRGTRDPADEDPSRCPLVEWERLTVVVMGRQLPRRDNLAVRYFAPLLGEPGEGRRIVYAESLFDDPKAL